MVVFTFATSCTAEAQPPNASIAFDPDYGRAEAKTLALDEAEIVHLEKGEGVPVVFFYPGFDYRCWQW